MTDYNRAQELCQKSMWPSWAPVPDKPTVYVDCKATLNQLTIQSPGREIIEEEGGELDSHEEVRLSFAGPGEIKRREVRVPQSRQPRTERQEQGGGAGLQRKVGFLSIQLFPNSCATDVVFSQVVTAPHSS